MDWLQGTQIGWYSLTKTRGDTYAALLRVRMSYQGKTAPTQDFILDTGAARTVAPLEYAMDLFDVSECALRKTDLKDTHGRVVEGIPISLELELPGPYPVRRIRLQETVWFCSGIRRGLLGQSSFFEQFGAVFLNFPDAPEGRCFGLFRRPGSLETLSFHTPEAWIHTGAGRFFFVEDDVLETEGGPGLHRYTHAEFTDFYLELDWRAHALEDRAGICLRLPSGELAVGQSDEMAGIEVALDARSMDAAWRTALRPLGEWSTLVLQSSGSVLRISLNGVEVRSVNVPTHELRSGHIGLRNYPGSRMQFRAPRIRPL